MTKRAFANKPVDRSLDWTKNSRMIMRKNNKGLTVKINMFPFNKTVTDTEKAHNWFRGQLTHADTKEIIIFHNAEEMNAILSGWHAAKFQATKVKSETGANL